MVFPKMSVRNEESNDSDDLANLVVIKDIAKDAVHAYYFSAENLLQFLRTRTKIFTHNHYLALKGVVRTGALLPVRCSLNAPSRNVS